MSSTPQQSTEESVGSDGAQPPVHNSSSSLWMVAGIPALLILAFLAYRAIVQSGDSSPAEAPETQTPAAPSAEPQGK